MNSDLHKKQQAFSPKCGSLTQVQQVVNHPLGPWMTIKGILTNLRYWMFSPQFCFLLIWPKIATFLIVAKIMDISGSGRPPDYIKKNILMSFNIDNT